MYLFDLIKFCTRRNSFYFLRIVSCYNTKLYPVVRLQFYISGKCGVAFSLPLPPGLFGSVYGTNKFTFDRTMGKKISKEKAT